MTREPSVFRPQDREAVARALGTEERFVRVNGPDNIPVEIDADWAAQHLGWDHSDRRALIPYLRRAIVDAGQPVRSRDRSVLYPAEITTDGGKPIYLATYARGNQRLRHWATMYRTSRKKLEIKTGERKPPSRNTGNRNPTPTRSVVSASRLDRSLTSVSMHDSTSLATIAILVGGIILGGRLISQAHVA